MKGILQNNTSFFGFGTSQVSRMIEALDPDYVQLDDRTISSLLSFAAEYSHLLQFYSRDNKADGDWNKFFTSDISVILATIISINPKSLENSFDTIIDDFYHSKNEQQKVELFIKSIQFIYDLAKQFDNWYHQISTINFKNRRFEEVIENELFNIISDKLVYAVQKLKAYTLAGSSKDGFNKKFELNFSDFHDIWDLENVASENIFYGQSIEEKANSSMLQIRLLFRRIFQTLNYTIHNFKKYFNQSLESKDDHKPDVALFICFLQLFKFVQNDYNLISSRLLRFYYQNYLKLNPRNPYSDDVFVNFTLAQGMDRYLLEKGTLLSGGLDEKGEEIVFETDQDLEVTQASINSFKTIFISRIDDLDTSHYKLVSHIYAANAANSLNGMGQPFEKENEEWPTFGEEQEYKPQDQINMRNSDIGFAIASPILQLNEGNRKITLKLNFTAESTRIYKRLVYDIHQKVNDNKTEDEAQNTLEDTFYQRIFNQVDNTRNFDIYLSGRKGWIEVDPNTVNIKAVGEGDWSYSEDLAIEENMTILNSLRIQFTLPISKPPVVAFDPDAFPEEYYDTFFPIIKFVLNDNKQPYSYSFFQNLKIADVDFEVSVDKVKRFDIFDINGGKYETKSFYPFGYEPSHGSQAVIGVAEMFRKNLTDVKFDINWENIPETVEDFKEHYKNYKEVIHPSSFSIRIGALSEYEVVMDYDELLEFPLFSPTEGDLEVRDHIELGQSEFHLSEDALYNLNLEPDPELPDELFYDDNAKTGFFIWELLEPRFGFGAPIYQKEYSDALAKNIEDPTLNKKFPNEPLIPIVKNMNISYTAKSSFSVFYGDQYAPEEIFHIHPFGIEKTYYDGSPEKDSLVPKFEEDGYLLIGLEHVQAPETISLHFELSTKKTKIQNANTVPEIRWKYLSYNTWRVLDESKVLFDSTEGFTQSGIVKLQLPIAITNQNDILEDGLFWISACVVGNTELLCNTIKVFPQAVSASRKISKEDLDVPNFKLIPPNTLTNLVNHKSEIEGLNQAFESFGGKNKETQNEYFYRVSERLRHKNRAITHWDFERIVLDRFPNVKQVKCISYLSNPEKDAEVREEDIFLNIEQEREDVNGLRFAEGIKLVAIPQLTKYIENKTPKFSLNKLLLIETEMKKLVPPFTKIQALNPQYQFIRVIANVKFIENMNNGLTLSKLTEDINKFISPWLYSAEDDIKIGGSLNENVLQNYVKGLSYVKFLTKFSLLHIIEDNGTFKLQDTAAELDQVSIVKARPWGVLLPDENHELEMIEYEEEEVPVQRVNTDEIIRFQSKVNILGDKKYIKIKNPTLETVEEDTAEKDTVYTVNIKI